LVLTADYQRIGILTSSVNSARKGLLLASSGADSKMIEMDYIGPDDVYAS
jgi:hypothetical protein